MLAFLVASPLTIFLRASLLILWYARLIFSIICSASSWAVKEVHSPSTSEERMQFTFSPFVVGSFQVELGYCWSWASSRRWGFLGPPLIRYLSPLCLFWWFHVASMKTSSWTLIVQSIVTRVIAPQGNISFGIFSCVPYYFSFSDANWTNKSDSSSWSK